MRAFLLFISAAAVAISAQAVTFKAPAHLKAPVQSPIEGGALITSPEGESTPMALYGHCYKRHDVLDMPLGVPVNALATEMVKKDNDVYLRNPFVQLPSDSYIKGVMESEDVMSFTFPQLIYENDETGEKYYVDRLEFVVEDETTGSGWFYADPDERDVTFTNTEEGWIMDYDGEEDILIGLCDANGDWTMAGYDSMDYALFDSQTINPPSELESADWTLLSDGIVKKQVKVGFLDDMVYIQGLSDTFPESWIEGYIDEDSGKVVVYSGQFLGLDDTNNSYVYMMTVRLDSYYDEFEESEVFEFKTVSRLSFAYDATLNTLTSDQYLFVNYGDRNLNSLERIYLPSLMESREMPEVSITPSTLEYQTWLISANNKYHEINLAFDGNDIYVKGISVNAPEGIIKGELMDDGTVVFASGQYLGQTAAYPAGLWFLAGRYEEKYDDFFDEYVKVTRLSEDIVFSYDSEKKRMTAQQDQLMLVNKVNDGRLMTVEEYANPVLRFPNENISPIPANPEVIWFWEWDDYLGSGTFMVNIPNTNADGDILDTSSMYYRYYMGGEIFELNPEYYPDVADYRLIPYDFSNGVNIFGNGTTHELYFVENTITDLGIQSVYVKDGKEYVSDIIYASGDVVCEREYIEMPELNIVKKEYFDLNGNIVDFGYKGMCIEKILFSDGTFKTIKKVIR